METETGPQVTFWPQAMTDYPKGRPRVPDLFPRLRALYRLCPAGGAAHVVTDDGNVENDSIDWCMDYIMAGEQDAHYAPDQVDAALSVLTMMRRMTRTQRVKALGSWVTWQEPYCLR